ncbi:MAG: flavodoxin-dependent (E)-4-hydroxy-3-methylbut-2-enyl-diphosphate synthase [Bacilli bacterium]|nr:flavodoxin-dependent (E)-4-hydroxy-3-methylbut-2-enyl-diphosphate synthase [Bacilli bacterium]
MVKRINTKQIKVGNIILGGQNNVIIQSMCNTKPRNIEETTNQILSLEEIGCEIIRVSIENEEDALALRKIKDNIHIPLVADIHFDYRLALLAIENGADKIRINPGNIGKEEYVKLICDKCNEKNIPIRIGVNSGSLEKEFSDKYGSHSVKGMVESIKKYVKLLESFNFTNIVLSLKSSDILSSIEANKQLSELFDYPIHIGITEAGDLLASSIKSSAGLGVLLYEGIGDTLRISITGDPSFEIKAAKELLSSFNLYKDYVKIISCPTCGRTNYDMLPIVNEIKEFTANLKKDIKIAIMGCVVNGPGEAKNADIGVAGGINEAILFKKGEIIKKIPQNEIIPILKEEIIKL